MSSSRLLQVHTVDHCGKSSQWQRKYLSASKPSDDKKKSLN